MAQIFVDSKLKPGKVTLFEKPSCPFCISAKEILEKYKFKEGHLEIINISSHELMGSIQDYFQQKTGARTVPRVFIGENCIGGCSDLTSQENNGELQNTLQKIGALE
ncbi:glutaredoxin-1 [Bombina bombina]|uniref:glutaredoxin-1 n=1 Tax=Bombina bombina TaxID=8345 RepID=UPI00235A8EBD|nr:glutaredoxin-1 [Bombina bombina]